MSLEKFISEEYNGLSLSLVEPYSVTVKGSLKTYMVNGSRIFAMTENTEALLITPHRDSIVVKFSFHKKLKYLKYLKKDYFGCVHLESFPSCYRKNLTIPLQRESLCKICNKSFMKNEDRSSYYDLDFKKWVSFSKINKDIIFFDYICPNCLKLMKFCPVCKKENHNSDIYLFLTSKDEKIKKMRESFFSLLKIKDKLINIEIGIPCCNCFKEIFRDSQNSSLRLLEQNIEINNQIVSQTVQNFREFCRIRSLGKRELTVQLKGLIARLIAKISVEDYLPVEDAFLIYADNLSPNMSKYDINAYKDELIRKAKERIKKMK